MDYKNLHIELDAFWNGKLRRVPNKDGKGSYFTYNNSKWNAPFANSLLEIMFEEMNLQELRLFLKILLNVKRGYDPITSGGLFLTYADYNNICSDTTFYKAKAKFIQLKLLIPVKSDKKYFILNPRYVIKMYNPKDK